MTSELDLLMKDFSEERKQSILKRADELEVYFSGRTVLMKGKDEDWVEGMLDNLGENDEII